MLLAYLINKQIRIFIVVLFSLLLQYNPAVSQATDTTFAFNALTINDGLSQGMVLRIFQDRYGFMWFATLDGLNRYDGYRFTVYRHDAQDPSSITESFVQSIFEDSKGRLWIGTISGGLDLFNRETETFTHIKHQDGNATSLAQGAVESITEDKRGNIWVHVSDKLEKLVPYRKEKATSEEFIIHHVRVPFASQVSLLTITKTGNIYYANAQDGVLYKLDNEESGKWSVALTLDKKLQQQDNKLVVEYKIVQLLEDKTKGVIYIFHDGGVIRFNDEKGLPERMYKNTSFKGYVAPMQASLDKHGTIWFSGIKNLSLFNTQTGQVNKAKAKEPDFYRPLVSIYSNYIDRSGLLWVGSSGYGILKRNIRSENFHHTGITSDYLIREADNGKILIGNNRVIKIIFDKTKGELVDALASNAIKKDPDQFRSFLFHPIATDLNIAWFADSNKLRSYNKNSEKSSYYTLPVTNSNEYTDLIQCKLKDSGRNIWLGTTEGLLRFSLVESKWTVYTNIPGDSSSISSNLIFSLCLDPVQPQRYLWIGTGGLGLNRMDMLTGKCIHYSTKDGLPNNVIYGILPDDDGNLWMSTNKGLACFNMLKQTFRNFDHKDGLQSNEFNRGAYCRTKDGYLFFGGVSGFNYFNPRSIINNKTIPQIVITGLKIHNQSVFVQPEGSPLKKVMYLTKGITLPYEQNFVSFEFASMDFTNSEKNLYQYKLQGIDNEWINPDNTHTATYTNLAPGTYTFKVKGSNNDGVWNENGTSVELIILPPWYMTWWFRTALAIVIIMGVYTFYRYRLSQALKLQSIRNRIAGDLHDEVGSNLSNIFIFSNVAQQKTKANDETGKLLQKITEYTQQSMEAMDDIVWMINARNDRFENIMIRMRTIAAEFSETSNCLLHLDFDDDLNNVHMNMEDRKNFYLIYKEAINNAAKYASCKIMWISMRLDHNQITLSIKDNGKGFDIGNTEGNGLFNMQNRAALLKGSLTITSSIGNGTHLQLNFKV